jgi:hypothetical protein
LDKILSLVKQTCRELESQIRVPEKLVFIRTQDKRFPSPRCAAAIQIVRLLESIAETQPQLQSALRRFSAIISQYFTPQISYLSRTLKGFGDSKENIKNFWISSGAFACAIRDFDWSFSRNLPNCARSA